MLCGQDVVKSFAKLMEILEKIFFMTLFMY